MQDERTNSDSAAYLFKYLLLANLFQYMEAGAVPALLLTLSQSFKMQPGQQGLLGAVVYLSLSLGGPLAGFLLRKYEHKTVILCSVGANLILTFFWAMTPVDRPYSTAMFISIRFIMGFTQCIVCVFLPLWTMENAPKTQRTIWMSYLQASVPFGVMAGYIVASVAITSITPKSSNSENAGSSVCLGLICWRWPFLLEIILLLPLFILFQFIPSSHVAVSINGRKRARKLTPLLVPTDILDVENNGTESKYPQQEMSATNTNSKKPDDESSSSNGSKDTETIHPLHLVDNQLQYSAFNLNGSSSTSIAAERRFFSTHSYIGENDSDDYRKYDDEYIRMKALALVEEKKQRLRLSRHSMSASMYDSMASLNVIKRSSDDYTFIQADDSKDLIRRSYNHNNVKSNNAFNGDYGSITTLKNSCEFNGNVVGHKVSSGEGELEGSLRRQVSASNMSEASDSSSKASQWVFSFVPMNWNSIWKSSMSLVKVSSKLSEVDIATTNPLNADANRVNSGASSLPFESLKNIKSHEVTPHRRNPANVAGVAVDADLVGMKTSTSLNLITRIPRKNTRLPSVRKQSPRKASHNNVQYESLRELPAVSHSTHSFNGINRQRSSTIPSAINVRTCIPATTPYSAANVGSFNSPRASIRNTTGLQLLSPLFGWKNSSNNSNAFDERNATKDVSTDDRISRSKSKLSRIRSKSLHAMSNYSLESEPIPSYSEDDLPHSPSAAKIEAASTKVRPLREPLRIQTALRSSLNHIQPTAVSATPMSNTDPYAKSGNSFKEVMFSADCEKDSILRHLMISKSSSDSNLPRMLLEDGYNKSNDLDISKRNGDRSSSGDGTRMNESAFSKHLNNGTRRGYGFNDTEEYYSNSESEEEWAGLDSSSLQSPTNHFNATSQQQNEQIWDFLSIFTFKAKANNKAVINDVEHHLDDSETKYLLNSEGSNIDSSILGRVKRSISALFTMLERDSARGLRHLRATMASVRALLSISVYRNLLGAMTALYFTVTGVQFWGTKYLSVALNAPLPMVNALFIICAATGPTSGVFFGGWLVDLFGGFKGPRQRVVALELCTTLGVLAFLFSLPITFVSSIFAAVPLMWLLLFFGGSTLPACSGIIVSLVPRRHRPTSSSLSLVVFNLFGYFLSLILSGLLMQVLEQPKSEISYFNCDDVCSMTWGFRLVLFWSFFSLYFLFSALRASYVHMQTD